jgi:hypothetical protein
MSTSCRKLLLASLLGGAALTYGFAGLAAAEPELAGSCAPNAVKYKVADRTATTSSENFVPLGGANISFVQAGPGSSCAIVSFTADARSEFPGTLPDVAIYLDGSLCRRGTLGAQQTDFVTTTINVVCPNVQPGSRRIEVKFRSSGFDGFVKLTNYTTVLHYRK